MTKTDDKCPECGGVPMKLHCESLKCAWRICEHGHTYVGRKYFKK